MAVEIREMNEEDEDHAEEYYNCSYDGMCKPKEKAIIFSCVGRDLKLPPLSKVHFPESLILKGTKKFSENIKPSHNVLDLMALRTPSPVLSNHNEQYENNFQSDHRNLPQCYDTSKSSSHPPLGTVSPQSQTSEVCSSQSVHEIVPSEASNSKEDDISDCNFNNSTTADVEDFLLDENLKSPNSLPLKGQDAFQATTITKAHKICDQKNLWKQISDPFPTITVSRVCSDKRNGQKPLPDSLQTPSKTKKNKRANRKSAWKPLLEAFQTSPPTAENVIVDQCTKPAVIQEKLDEIYLRKNRESATCKLFGSKDRDKSFIDHFKSCNLYLKDSILAVENPEEFPDLPTKQTLNSQKQSTTRNLPENQSKLKKEKSLLHANANTDRIGGKVATARETKTPQVLIIENLPQDISKENLEDLLMDFGKVLSLELLPFCDKITAQIKMDSDLEGIICILNGSCVFGANSEPIICYQKQQY